MSEPTVTPGDLPPHFAAGTTRVPNPVQHYAQQFAVVSQRLDDVMRLHQPDVTMTVPPCTECGKTYPCPTAIVLLPEGGDLPVEDEDEGEGEDGTYGYGATWLEMSPEAQAAVIAEAKA